MPIYEFFCEDCDFEIEEFQKFSDPAPKCPNHKKEMKKKVSLTFIRKGAGLYSIDTPSKKSWGDLE